MLLLPDDQFNIERYSCSTAHPSAASVFNSLERRGRKTRDPDVAQDSVRLKRRFSNPDNSWGVSPERAEPQRRKLSRSVSDAGRREEKNKEFSIFGTLDRIRKKNKKKPPVLEPREEVLPPVRKKKQLSPIMESSPAVGADTQEPWR